MSRTASVRMTSPYQATVSGSLHQSVPSMSFCFLRHISHLSIFCPSPTHQCLTSSPCILIISSKTPSSPLCLPHLVWQTAIVKVTAIKAVLVRWLLCKAVMMWANKGPDPQTDRPLVFYSLALQPAVKFHCHTSWQSLQLPLFHTQVLCLVCCRRAVWRGDEACACAFVNADEAFECHAGIFWFIHSVYFSPHPSLLSLQKSVRTGCRSTAVCVAALQLSLTVWPNRWWVDVWKLR